MFEMELEDVEEVDKVVGVTEQFLKTKEGEIEEWYWASTNLKTLSPGKSEANDNFCKIWSTNIPVSSAFC